MKWLWILSLLVLMSGCSFQMRGQNYPQNSVHSIYLHTDNPYSVANKQIKAALNLAKIKTVQQPSQAPYIVYILHEATSMNPSGYGMNNQVSMATVSYYLTFRVTTSQGKEILAPVTVTAMRYFTINTNQPLLAKVVPDYIVTDMRTDAVYQMIARLNAAVQHPGVVHEVSA